MIVNLGEPEDKRIVLPCLHHDVIVLLSISVYVKISQQTRMKAFHRRKDLEKEEFPNCLAYFNGQLFLLCLHHSPKIFLTPT